MNFADDAAARAAWLTRSAQDMPSWGPGASVAPPSMAEYSASVDTVRAAAAQALSGAWLVPGAPVLTLAAADEMTSVALNEAAARGFNPVSVCVLDPAGRVLVSKTMVACPTLAPELAKAKARTCVGFHVSSRFFKDNYISADGGGPKMPQALAMGIVGASAGLPIASFPGGVLCRDTATGAVVGAIGVSGASADEDEHCAVVGAQACSFKTEPAKSALQ